MDSRRAEKRPGDGEGRASGVAGGVAGEAMERIVAERTLQLRESEARYRRLVEGLQEEYFFFTLGPDLTFSYISPSVENVLGWPPEDVLGQRPEVFRMEGSRLTLARVGAQARAGHAVEPFVAEVRHAEGGTRFLEIRLAQVFDADGDGGTIEGIARDVTRRLAAEDELRRARDELEQRVRERTGELRTAVEALRRSEREMLAAQRAGRMGSWVLDLVAETLSWSEPTYLIHGMAPDATPVTLRDAIGMIHPEDRAAADSSWKTMPERREPFESEYRIVTPDGAVRHLHLWAEPEVRDGRTERVRGMVQDVTRQRMAEAEAGRQRGKLAEAERLASLGTLLAGLTHELNNPNHSILLNVPVLRRAWQDAAPLLEEKAVSSGDFRLANVPWSEMRTEVPQVIDEIEQAAERIKRLVSRLREYALKHRPAIERLDVNAVVRAVVELVGETVEAATSRFSLELAEDLPAVSGASFRLEQVVAGLVLNACESLSDRKQGVRIVTGRTAGGVFVQVQDEGRGIAEEDLPHVRDPFFTTRRAEGATGLGLAVAARIAREHGGTLDLESELGAGTTVTVTLPVDPGHVEEGDAA